MIRLKRLPLTLVALLLGAPSVWAAVSWTSPGPTVPAVELSDQDGRARQLAALIGHRPVLVSFFFTACARICPPQTALLREVQEELNRRRPTEPPLLLSISLNPLADTPPALRAYAALFDARLGERDGWLMLTGSSDALAPVWKAFDADGADPNQHADTLWIGHPGSRQWTRASALSAEVTAARLADLLLDAAP